MTGFAVPSMLTQVETVAIRVLARRGETVRVIAKQLNCSRNLVRRYLRDGDTPAHAHPFAQGDGAQCLAVPTRG